MIPLELIEFLHNLKDRDYDLCGSLKIDKAEADKLIKAIESLKGGAVNE